MTEKQKQLKNNEDIFISNQQILRDMWAMMQISKKELEQFTTYNVKQFEETRNNIVFS